MTRPTTPTVAPIRSSLRHLDVADVSERARREARARQTHLPPVSVYRWWARRTESVGGAILDAFSRDHPGRLKVADPFAGGGVLGLAALIRGHQVYVQDVNPWAARSLATTLSLPGPELLARAARELEEAVTEALARAYATTMTDGTPAQVVHTIRVAVGQCPSCSDDIRLFPTGLVSMLQRVDSENDSTGYVACPAGHVQLGPARKSSRCTDCARVIAPGRRYTTNRMVRCTGCGWKGTISDVASTPLRRDVVLVERRAGGQREIGPPSGGEREQASEGAWSPVLQLPPIGDNREASVLLRHGFKSWHELYPARQRVVLDALEKAAVVVASGDDRMADALRAAVLGSVEMAGFVSRWDGRYLKAYEAVANHHYSFTTLPVEPNVWGVGDSGRGTVSRRMVQLEKASAWLEERTGKRLAVQGPLPQTARRRGLGKKLDARVVAGSSDRMVVADGELQLVLTDPPYHDDVQYGDLSELFRAWAGMGTDRLSGEAVAALGEGTFGNYESALTRIFREIHRALASDGHLILSYANRSPDAWVSLIRSLDGAGFRAVGFEVVHSENELDHSKVGRRACTMDVLVDCVPAAPDLKVVRHAPKGQPVTTEETFCRLVGRQALEIGQLRGGWETAFVAKLRSSPFLEPTRGRTSP